MPAAETAEVSGWEVRAGRSGEAGVLRASLSLVVCGELLDLPLRPDPLPLSLSFSAFQMQLLLDARQMEGRKEASISRHEGVCQEAFLG